MTPMGTPFMARCEPWVWRRMWKVTAGAIFGPGACLVERPLLVRRAPGVAIGAEEDQIGRCASRRPGFERGLGLVGQHDMAHLALAEPDRQRAAVGVELVAFEAGELGVAAAGQQRCLHQFPKILRAGIDQPAGLRGGEIAHHRLVDALERFHLAPGGVGGDAVGVERAVESRLQHGEDPVGGRLAGAAGVLVVGGFASGRLGRHPLAANALGLGGELVAPTVEAIDGQLLDLDRAELR